MTQVGDKAKAVDSQLQGREPSEILDQARDFARRRPGTFLPALWQPAWWPDE